MQNKISIKEHLNWLYEITPSTALKSKGVLDSVILYWEKKLKEHKI